jgi:nucleotide-binding universal stress UspA family protein
MRADLILMGIGGGGALRRILLGSTTHAVLREAPCPVLTMRATEAMPDFETLDVIHAAAR